MPDPIRLHISFPDKEPYYVAIEINGDYIEDPVVVGMTVVKGLATLREHIRQAEDDGA